jgi:hypothetical protein
MLLALPLILGVAPAPDLTAESLAALRGYDQRLATIGYRLATANVALCDDQAPTPGWALHAIDQYPAALAPLAKGVFGFAAPIAVEAVVASAPAARAGVRADDALVAIGGTVLGPAGSATSSATRDAATAAIAAQPAAAPLAVTVLRDGVRQSFSIPASPGCRTVFEILLGPQLSASADGRLVQIGVRFFDRYTDDQIAAVVAHELSHNILHHRVRLEAAGVKWGLLAELGRNGRLFRRTEAEADQLSVSLLRNAGYDPHAATRFWREHGGDVDGGLFRSRTHPSSSARAEAIEAEIAHIPATTPIPYVPPLWSTRNDPLR